MNLLNELFGMPLVISLVRRPDRRERFAVMAKEIDLQYTIFDAVDGQKLFDSAVPLSAEDLCLKGLIDSGYMGRKHQFLTVQEAKNDHDTHARGAGRRRRCGMLACRLSHMEAMTVATFIMEDDAVACKDFEKVACALLPIPKHDVLYLGTGILDPNECERHAHPAYRTVHNSSRTHAYILSIDGMQQRMRYCLNASVFANFDTGLKGAGYYNEAVALATVKPLFQQADYDESDIQFAGEKPQHDTNLEIFND